MAKRKSEERGIEKWERDNGPIFDPITDYHLSRPTNKRERELFKQYAQEIDEQARRSLNLEYQVNLFKAELLNMLEPYRIPSGQGFGYSVPDDAPSEMHDALTALHDLHSMLEYQEEGRYDRAILMGIYLGVAMTRAGVREYEKFVSTGKSIREAVSKGGRNKGGLSPQERTERNERLKREVEQYQAGHPGRSLKEACEVIAYSEYQAGRGGETFKPGSYRKIWNLFQE